MPDNKRPVKRVKSFRLTWAMTEILAKIVRITGDSESTVMSTALMEYFKNHPEFWPEEKRG